jgi:hypothetical protein
MSIRTIALSLSATLALITAPFPFGNAQAAEAPAAAASAAAFDDSTPEALIGSIVKALKSNDLAAFWRRLPAADQQRIQEGWTRMTGNQFFAGMIDRRLTQLTSEQLTASVVPALTGTDPAVLSAHLTQFATNGEAPPADANAAGAGGPPGGFGGFGGFGRGGGGGAGGPLMAWFESAANEVVNLSLATGLESQQIDVFTALFKALSDWAAKAPFTDKDKATAFTAELVAAVEALGVKTGADVTGLTVNDLIAKIDTGVPHIKAGFALYDLQIDAVLDTVKVSDLKPVAGATDTMSGILHATTFGADRALPLKFVKKDGHWAVSADSPLLSWLRARGPGLMQMVLFGNGRGGPGGPGGNQGRNRGQRPGGQNGQNGQGGQNGQAPDPNPAAPKPNPGF